MYPVHKIANDPENTQVLLGDDELSRHILIPSHTPHTSHTVGSLSAQPPRAQAARDGEEAAARATDTEQDEGANTRQHVYILRPRIQMRGRGTMPRSTRRLFFFFFFFFTLIELDVENPKKSSPSLQGTATPRFFYLRVSSS